MFWTILTIVAALGQSSKDTLAKRLSGQLNAYTLSAGITFCLLVLVAPFLFFNNNWQVNLSLTWLIVFILTGAMFAVSQVLMNKAFSISDLSVTIPILNFSPFWALLLSPFLLGEIPTLIQLGGIVLITVGAYILKLTKDTKSFFEPIKHLFIDKGSQYMLIVSFVWGLDTILGKIGARETNAYFWTFSTRLLTFLILVPFALKKDTKFVSSILKHKLEFLLMGIFVGFSIVAQTIAVLQMPASLNSALLRFGTLFSVILGTIFFKEKNFGYRFVGALVMIVGVILISFWR